MKTLFASLGIIILLFFGLFAQKSFPQQEEFLVGYWAFDEGKGDTAKDGSGKGNDGKINGKFEWVDGRFGKALSFTPGAYVEIQDSDTLRDMKELTIAMWVYFNDFAPAWNHLLEKDGSYGLTVNTAGGDFRYSPNTAKVWVVSKVKVEKKKWYYIAMVWDGSTTSFYVNGEKKSDTKEPMVFTDSNINIAHPSPYTVDGIIDEVKFWAKALSPAELEIAMKGESSISPSGKLATTWGSVKRKR